MENITIETIDTEITDNGDIDVSGNNNINIIVSEPEFGVTVNKKEYVITGDDIYVPTRYEESPQWLRDLISTITDTSFNQKITELNNLTTTLNQLIVELDVAKNTYTNSIISSADIDERINTNIETLNSSLRDSDATIVDLVSTKVTPTEATSLATTVLSSSINGTENGTIGALVGNVQTAIANLDYALSEQIDIVHSEMIGDYEISSNAINKLSAYVGVDDSNFIPDGTGLLKDIEILQKQVDGVIETVTGTHDVMYGNSDLTYDLVETAEPYATWFNSEVNNGELVRASHVGDTYIKYQLESDGSRTYLSAYKFIKTIVDTTAPYGTDNKGYTWAIVTNTDTQNAYMAALKAYDLADSKRRVFITTPFGPYESGDLWTNPAGELMRCKDGINNTIIGSYNVSDWELAVGYTENLQAYADTIVENVRFDLKNQIDKKIEYWFNVSTSDPKLAWTTSESKLEHNGDVWYQTDTKISYYYSNITNTWNLITNKDALDAIELANTAQSTADGKITVYYALEQSTAPATTILWYKTTDAKLYKYSGSWILVDTLTVGDLLYTNNGTEDNRPYRYSGSAWVSARDGKVTANASAITALDTKVNDPITGTIVTAVSEVEQSLSTVISDGDTLVESKWGYNSNVNIGGVNYSSGFGLATSVNSPDSGIATGDSQFWINASKFKFTNTNKTGSVSPFTIDASGTTPQITFNGKVAFTNVTGYTAPDLVGGNLLYNSEPMLGSETVGWAIGSNNTGLSAECDAGFDIWRPSGAGSVYILIYGTPISGTIFHLFQPQRVPIIPGTKYAFGSLLSSHRCNATVRVNVYNDSGVVIAQYTSTMSSNAASSGALSQWGNGYWGTFVAPVGASNCIFYIEGTSIGQIDPYVFVARAMLCKYSGTTPEQIPWSEGKSVGGIASNNDIIAQKLGFLNYAEMITAANLGKTIIIGGYMNTNLIQSNAIAANQINTNGLIAENISATEIVGKNIQGAVITGSVIKASYLDLDGELEVLTNYHITPAMYNANPSLYTDAVYLSGTNEWRIPSISMIREETKIIPLHSIGASGTSLNRSYNTANAGHNNKCVTIRPTLNYNGTVLTITVNVAPLSSFSDSGNKLTSYSTSLYCFGEFIARFKIISTSESGSEFYTQMYVNDVVVTSFSTNFNGLNFTSELIGGFPGGTSTLNINVSCPNTQLYANFTTGNILSATTNSLPSRTSYGVAPANVTVSSTSQFKTSSSMTINNMI